MIIFDSLNSDLNTHTDTHTHVLGESGLGSRKVCLCTPWTTHKRPAHTQNTTFQNTHACMQWFFANYLYAIGLDKTTVAAVNTISGSSGVFVMILAALPILNVTEGDKFTLTRLTVTLVRYVLVHTYIMQNLSA